MKLNWAERLAVNNPTRPVQQKIEISWMKKKAGLDSDAKVLEIGCGRGAGADLIIRIFDLPGIIASDLDIRMIRMAGHYLPGENRKKLRFHAADAYALPYGDGTMDAVFGFGVLHHVPDWQTALREVARILKPGGRYYLEEILPAVYLNFITKHVLLHPRENRFKAKDLKEEVKKKGLVLEHTLEIPPFFILGVCRKG